MKKRIGLLIIVFCIVLISFVSADPTCSFINITQGPQGIPGVNGTNGTNGTSCTITAGTATVGTPLSVTNIGTTSDAIFDFVIPAGPTGATGSTGAKGDAGTITINSTISGTPASVTNIGTSSSALLDFVIPPGDKGDKGDTGLIPDVTQFLFLNGTRAMTGIFQMGGYNISNVLDPVVSQDAATKNYVDTRGYITSTFNATYDAKPSSTYNSTYDTTSTTVTNNLNTWNATYNSSYLTSTYNSTYDATSTTVANNLNNWNSTFNATYDAKPSSTYNTTYDVTSTTVANNLNNWNATYNATYDSKPSSTYNSTYDAKVGTDNTSYVLTSNTSYPVMVGGIIPTANLGSNTANNTSFLSGDQTWQPGIKVLKKTSNQTINGGAATFVDVSELTFPVTNGNNYAFHYYIVFSSRQTTTGWKMGVNAPTGILDFWAESDNIANAAAGAATHLERHNVARDDMTQLTTTVTGNVTLANRIDGMYQCTQNGTFAVRFANELAANTDIVVWNGSYGWYF